MLRPGRKNIAVCFSGQPRTWKRCVASWKKHLFDSNSEYDIDIFCHVWDYNTIPNALTVGQKITSSAVPQKEIDELIETLKPKKYIVEQEKKCLPINQNQPVTFYNFLGQYYGIMQSARLKRQHELQTHKQYDLVVRMRYDSFFMEDIKLVTNHTFTFQNKLQCFHYGWDTSTHRGRIGDIFWYTDSDTYDIIADYYLNLTYMDPKFYKNCSPETIMYHYLKKNDIELEINHWDVKLFRESQELSWSKNKNGFEIW